MENGIIPHDDHSQLTGMMRSIRYCKCS